MLTGSARVLDPQERVSEILFGLIMALSFTGAIQVSTAGRDEVRPVLVAALGCNVAWGIIDAVLYLMSRLVERSRRLVVLRRFADADSDAARREVLAEQTPLRVVEVLRSEDLATLSAFAADGLRRERVRLTSTDLRGAAGVFLLVVAATFPVVLPYFFTDDVTLAKRVSNGVSLVMMFLAGCVLGRYTGVSPARLGLAMVLLGVFLVGLTIALGG
jgi:VIT1/CCC1 family predicted Fe2+/Mn2+ transporter